MLWIKNKLETSKDALWKRKNFNTENWKPCTLDLSPCGKRNAEKSRLGHLWIVFYKSYPTLFALSHPFKPLVDYRLLCSQYNTGKTLEPACQRGLLLALKISIFGQLCLFPISKICHYGCNPIYDGDWAALAVYCNVGHGRGWMAVKRQPYAGFVNNSQRVDSRVSCFIGNVII